MIADLKVSSNSDKIARAFRDAPHFFIEEANAAVTEGSLLLEREVKERTPTSGAGILRESIGALPVTIGERAISGGVGTSLAYAPPVELGSKPHWMPIEPLEEWVMRKLAKRGDEVKAVARLIWFKIGKKGTKGKYMFRDGARATEPQILDMFERAADRALERMEVAAR